MNAQAAIGRNPQDAAGRHYDVVVAGGGVYGILLALESAARGLATLLVEKHDFGAGASFNSLRTIHGGLRYLQSLDLRRARQSARQRAWWLCHFPDLVAPIQCLMPLYGGGLRRPAAFRAAFVLGSGIGLFAPPPAPGQPLPSPRVLDRDQVLAHAPHARRDGLRGGAMWSDAFMAHSQRVIVESLRWAVDAGADALNYAELQAAVPAGPRRSRLQIVDSIEDRSFEVTASTVLNAAGADVEALATRLTGERKRFLHPTLAWNLLLDIAPPSDCSLAVAPPWPGARTYFLHPYGSRVLAGTGHAPLPAGAGDRVPDENSVSQMLRDLDAALPGAGLGDAPLRRVLCGILPGVAAGREDTAVRPSVVRHRHDGAAIYSVVGVKFTEAPELARRVLDRLHGKRRAPLPPRPAAADGWRVAHIEAPPDRRALLELASRESVVFLDDLLERRTDAWLDEDCRRRLEELLGADLRRHAA